MVHFGFAIVFGFVGLVAFISLMVIMGWLIGHVVAFVQRCLPVVAWAIGLFVILPWVIGRVA